MLDVPSNLIFYNSIFKKYPSLVKTYFRSVILLRVIVFFAMRTSQDVFALLFNSVLFSQCFESVHLSAQRVFLFSQKMEL